jgi:hypothetical protein
MPDPDYEVLAVQAGQAWADARAGELRRAGRPVAGGWPGTIKEGMPWVLATLGGRVAHADMSIGELRSLARTAWSIARKRWLALSDRDADDDQ